jgi:hypothetical protein
MGVGTAASAASRGDTRAHVRALTPAQTAWACLLPCAIATVVAVLVLGPPLGRALLGPRGEAIYPGVDVRPEPVEHARYALAVLGPLLLAGLVALRDRRPLRLSTSATRVLVGAGQAGACLFAVGCLLAQYGVLPGAVRLPWTAPTHYFTPPTLALAAAAALLTLVVLRVAPAARLAAMTRETRARRAACLVVAVVLIADWLLRAVNSDSTIGGGTTPLNLMPWEMSESFAILNGRTPLADFHAMYSHLWSYLVAGSLGIFGASAATWTVTMAALSGLAMLAVYALLRRLVRSSLIALILFAPFLAISFWVVGPPQDGISLATLFSMWPLRYGGPFVLAWLTARHLDGARPRRAWVLFFAAGLVLVNNLEFGAGAFAATLAATALRPTAGRLRLLGEAAAGLAAAAAFVALVTLVHGGRLPRPELALEFPRLFGVEGWGLEPMPATGLHLALFATFAAAFVVAVARTAERADGRALTGMCAWAGVFGLGAGTYYLGRSNPGNLIPLFSAWSFALAILTIVSMGALARRAGRRPTLPQLTTVFGFALGIAMLAGTPGPWAQIERLGRDVPERPLRQPAATAFVQRHTERGDAVAILAPLGFRMAHELGLENVSPYVAVEAMRTPGQVRTAIDTVERASIRTVFVKAPGAEAYGVGEESGNVPPVLAAFEAAGFAVAGEEPLLIVMRR